MEKSTASKAIFLLEGRRLTLTDLINEMAIRVAGRKASSPRPWGCFPVIERHHPTTQVFPTPVGVFLGESLEKKLIMCLPHARGGVSSSPSSVTRNAQSSTRPWGCFYLVTPG